MALVNCRECNAEVSAEAKTCPKCGISNPAVRPTSFIERIIQIAVVIGIFWLMFQTSWGQSLIGDFMKGYRGQ